MYTTRGIDAVATITEIRSNTSALVDHARKNKSAVLIQKNNDPYAVLLDWETYQEMLKYLPEGAGGDRPPKRRERAESGNRATSG